MQPCGRRPAESQRDGLAARGGEAMFGRLAHDLRAESIGYDEPRVWRKNVPGKSWRYGEVEAVTEVTIAGPFVVGAKVRQARLDLDDDDITAVCQADKVGSQPIRQRQFRKAGDPVLREFAATATRDVTRRLGLSAIDGRYEIGLGSQRTSSRAIAVAPVRDAGADARVRRARQV